MKRLLTVLVSSVHNSYMIASAWTILHELLIEMKRLGLQDKMVIKQMRSSAQIRTLYMLTYNMAKNLVIVGQQRLRSIVQNTGKNRTHSICIPPRSETAQLTSRLISLRLWIARMDHSNSTMLSFAICISLTWIQR